MKIITSNYYVASFTAPYENLKEIDVFKTFIERKFYFLWLLNLLVNIKMMGLYRLKQHIEITKYNYKGTVIGQKDETSNTKNTDYTDSGFKMAINNY